ncbi:hypothetical protein VAZ01S_016_00150 [Vibrio azureus NBRC 104587]|uniref:Uncharacterized protein n=2 Tax=Vibrio harveyi group TaxID=717610 RepID=U3A4D0_9VIBR|nr:hypothetical protein VAZ01S_016_00150 [Vibrio azureus NBRC 104587]GEM74849.1 hypothetical protein VSA01S_09610 [Vibrio sagamiensis NBRC 104589]
MAMLKLRILFVKMMREISSDYLKKDKLREEITSYGIYNKRNKAQGATRKYC